LFPFRRGVVAALLCTAAVVSMPVGAQAAPTLPTQGVYDMCTPARSPDHCESRLRRIGDAGFRVVQNMRALDGADLPDILAFANAAHAHGIKVIWSLNSASHRASLRDLMPGLPARCGCQDEDRMLAYLIGVLRSQPATWGYYIADEPSPADHDEVAAFAAQVKALDPYHERLIMGCGLCWGGEKSVDFLADVDATLGTDAYPVHEQGPDRPVVAKRVADDAAGLQRVADRAGRKTVIALQAWRWGDSHYDSEATGIGPASRFPTRREIEIQRNAAITSGRPELILWFTLNQVIGWEPGQRPWWWAEPTDAGQRWANLVGGAFAPLPNDPPTARFTLRTRRGRRVLRVRLNASRSRDPDGRIVRYRWYGKRGRPLCGRRRCSIRIRRSGRHRVRLVVTDSRGAKASRSRWILVSRAALRRR
jgi:hypothetical protein